MSETKKQPIAENCAEQVNGGAGGAAAASSVSAASAPAVSGSGLGEPFPIIRYDVPEPEELNPEILLLKHF